MDHLCIGFEHILVLAPPTHLLHAVYFHVGIALEPLMLLLPVGGLRSLFDVAMATIADHTQYSRHQGKHCSATN